MIENSHTMQAVRFEEFGAPHVVLQVVRVPRPAAGSGQVLVRVEAAAINPSDVKNVQGSMRAHTILPRTPGRDFAGTVVEGPPELRGKAVWGTGGDLGFNHDGTHAEFVLLPIDAVAPRPEKLTASEAAAVGVGFVTAWTGLMEKASLTPGEAVLIIGSGAVGSAAAQIAKWKGASLVLTTVQSALEENASPMPGVDVVIDLSKGSLHDQVKAATKGKYVSLVYNTVGGPLFEPGLKSLAIGGRMVVISAATGDSHISLNLLDFYRRELRLFGVNTLLQTATDGARLLTEMAPGFESGDLTPPIVETRSLRYAADAYHQVAHGTKSKLVLLPD